MGYKFAELMFTDSVKAQQEKRDSRELYEYMEKALGDRGTRLNDWEAQFIEARDSFYMATVNENGWPYVQHRGGEPGFVKALPDKQVLVFADYSGNQQYVSTGNITKENRVSLLFMDYPNRERLKVLGRVSLEEADDYPDLTGPNEAGEHVNGVFVVHVEATDWNCPKYITRRYTQDQVDQQLADLKAENERLQQEIDVLRAGKG